MLFHFSVLLSIVAASVNAACCAYGGDGNVVLEGVGTMNPFPADVSPSKTLLAPLFLGVSANPIAPFVMIAFMPKETPQESVAGWLITPGAAGKQILYAWSNTSATPVCSVGEGVFVASFGYCAGSPASLFPSYYRSFAIGQQQVLVFAQAGNVSTVSVTSDSCTPVSMVGLDTPLGSGAFSFDVEGGAAQAPPPGWGVPPSYCPPPPQ